MGLVARKTLVFPVGEGEESWPCRTLIRGGLGARKTPHRFRPKTPESASPLGEGEDRRLLEGVGAPTQLLTEFGWLRTGSASPLGEGEERRAPWALSSVRGCRRVDRDRKTPYHRIESPGSRPGQAGAGSKPVPPGRGSKSSRVFEDAGRWAKVSQRETFA